MRVAFLTHAYGGGHGVDGGDGVVGRHVRVLATAIARAGGTAEVLLHTTRHRDVPSAEEGITIRCFSSWVPGKYAAPRALWSYLRRHSGDFDLLHVHGERMLPALLVAQGTPQHLIVTPHFYASSGTHLRRMAQGRGEHLADRQLLARAERVLCVSQSEALLVSRYAPDASVTVVPNGSDADSIAPPSPHPMDRHVIVSVDRLTRWAGIQRVISALPALPSHYTLIVVGRGRARSMLEAHADYLGVADRVRFAGGVTDAVLHRLLRTASVVATLKEEDLWGGTLLTAACAGTPVVASDMPAHREAARLAGSEGISFVSRRASPLAVADAVTELSATGDHPFAALVPRWADLAEETMSIYREVLDDEP